MLYVSMSLNIILDPSSRCNNLKCDTRDPLSKNTVVNGEWIYEDLELSKRQKGVEAELIRIKIRKGAIRCNVILRSEKA